MIADNIGTEHRFSQAILWMDYLEDEQTLPVPFNVIPSLQQIIDFFAWITGCCCGKNDSERIAKLEKDEGDRYEKVYGVPESKRIKYFLGRSFCGVNSREQWKFWLNFQIFIRI